jgi:hypothetical protein
LNNHEIKKKSYLKKLNTCEAIKKEEKKQHIKEERSATCIYSRIFLHGIQGNRLNSVTR